MKNLIKPIMLMMLLVGFNAKAGLIEIDVDQNEVSAGSSVTVSLIATGFDEFDLFDLDFVFDNSLFTYDNGSLQSDLPLDDGLFVLGLLATPVGDHLALSFFDFIPFVGGDFLLAKFDLVSSGKGVSDFSFANVSFDNLFGPLTVVNSSVQQVRVNGSTAVPEPATWALLVLSMLFIFAKRVRNQG